MLNVLNNAAAILELRGPSAGDSSLGALEVGSMVAMGLFGISTGQVYMYFRACSKDPLFTKSFVVFIWLLEFSHTFLTGWMIYKSTIIHPPIETIWQANMITGMIGALISGFAQVYFSYRLRVLSSSNILPGFCCLAAFFKIVAFWTVVIQELITGMRTPPYEKLTVTIGVVTWGNDLLLASGMGWCIWKRNKEREFSRTHVDKVMLWFFETNVVTCLMVTVLFISGQAFPQVLTNFIWIPLTIIICRLYSMCIFASLIGKAWLSEQMQINVVGAEFGSGPLNFSFPPEPATNATLRF